MLTSCCYCFLNCIHFSSFQNSDCFRVTERTTEYNAIPRCMAVMLLWILNNKPIDTKRYDIHWGLLFLVLIRFPMCISFTIMIHFPSFAWKWWTKLQFNMQETLGGEQTIRFGPSQISPKHYSFWMVEMLVPQTPKHPETNRLHFCWQNHHVNRP